MLKKITIAAAVVLTIASSLAVAGSPASVSETNKGKVLVDNQGMTLYTFTKDTKGHSLCTGQCSTNWPVFRASAESKNTNSYTIITREDGVKQWAYKDQPLYTWIKDSKPGDTTGDGINGVWRVAKP